MDPNINPQDVELREQDRWLPIANVARLMKNTLPTTAKVSKDAKECMQECVSEFISFITSEASDKCLREKRKTINGEDILYSMHDLGFENYAEVLKIYLAKYREQQALRQERGETRASKRLAKVAASVSNDIESEITASATLVVDFKDESEETEFSEAIPFHQEHDLDSNSVTNVNSAIASTSSTSSIASPEPYFDSQFNADASNGSHSAHEDPVKVKEEGEPEHEHEQEHEQDPSNHNVEDYRYEEFIHEEEHNTSGQHHIEEFSKISHDEPDIDTLTAGITNTTANGGYF